MSLDLLSCMKSFAAIAEYKGFSSAAIRLQVSTPVLTKQLQRLESMVGKRLFHRTTRQINLTEAGKIYLSHVRNILYDIQKANEALRNLETEPHGQLKLGLTMALNIKLFTIFQRFNDKYPKIKLHTTEEKSLADLSDGTLDLIISEVNCHDKKINKELLLTIQPGIFASPGYLEKHGVPKTISDLKNHNCLIYNRLTPNNEWEFARNKKVKVNGNYSSDLGLNIIHAAIAGLGLLSCSDILITEEIASGRLVEVTLEKKPLAKNFYIYYRPTNNHSIIKLMVDHLKQYVSL